MKETLESKRHSLYEEKEAFLKVDQDASTQRVKEITQNIHPYFSDFEVLVENTNITFKVKGGYWHNGFEIVRRPSWTKDGEVYGHANVRVGSWSDPKESELKVLVCVGKIAEAQLKNAPEWSALTDVMNEYGKVNKEKYKNIYKQIREIDDTLRLMKQAEESAEYNKVFTSGKMKLNKPVSFYYGAGKWDRIHSEHFEWEKNGTGKTYTVFYFEKRRTNVHYDESGNAVEPVYETIKRTVTKRIRLNDLETFIKQNVKSIID